MFKKTTKTDKTLAITNRVKFIQRHVTNQDKLFILVHNIACGNTGIYLGGRSIRSLIIPLITNGNQRWNQFSMHWLNYNIKEYSNLSYGIRVVCDPWTKYSGNNVANVFNQIFKVSKVKVRDDGFFEFVIKNDKPTGRNVEFSNQDEMNTKIIQLRKKIEDKKLDLMEKVRLANEANRRVQDARDEISGLERDLNKIARIY